MKNKLNSIRIKVLFYLILFSVFILLVLWGTQLLLSDFLYEKYQISDIERIANVISDTDYEDLHNYLSEVVYKNAVCIEYIDEFGISSGKEIKAIKLVNPDYDSSALLYGVEVDNDGYVFIYTMLSNVNKNYRLVKSQLIYITIIVIIRAIRVIPFCEV